MVTDAWVLDRQIEASPLKNGFYTGRRRRVFAHAITFVSGPKLVIDGNEFKPEPGVLLSYNGVYEWLCRLHPGTYPRVLTMSLHIGEPAPQLPPNGNLTLTHGLQDLADEIQTDIHEALYAFDNPSLWYPGVDSPAIVPLPDDHVPVVMTAMQRELDKELRDSKGGRRYYPEEGKPETYNLPAAQLAELPWNIQRALAERRRLRFAQFGITPESWRGGMYSLWNVPEESDWLPRNVMENDGITAVDEPRVMPGSPDPIISWVFEGVDHFINKEVWHLYIDGEYIRTEHRPPLWD